MIEHDLVSLHKSGGGTRQVRPMPASRHEGVRRLIQVVGVTDCYDASLRRVNETHQLRALLWETQLARAQDVLFDFYH